MEKHVTIFKDIYTRILFGYSCRNPLSRDGQEILHGDFESSTGQSYLEKTSTISFLTGKSGVGKSTLIKAILNSLGNQVIQHSSYNGEPFTKPQIAYLKHNAPEKCGPKAICEIFGDQVDSLMGTNESKYLFPDKGNQTKHVINLRKMLISKNVGILVVDACENISLARSGGKTELAALFGNMRDGLGVPLFLVGTYKAESIYKRNLSSARRFSEGGFYELENPSSPADEDWANFCETVWSFQWVRKPKPFTENIRDILFDLSQGITGIMLTLFIRAQKEAINRGTEVVDEKMLRYVYRTQLQPVHEMLNALRSKTIKSLAKYEDVYRISTDALNEAEPQNRYDELAKQTKQNQKATIATGSGVVTKPARKSRKKDRPIEELTKMVLG
jgi:hypothetical protein